MTHQDISNAIYQSFEETTDPSNVASRVAKLRGQIAEHKVDAFLIPRSDVHRGESVPDSEARLAYVTGFTGSAGFAIVGLQKAALFVDGRYELQGPAQTDTRIIDVKNVPQDKLSAWVKDNLTAGAKIGFDPWLHTQSEIKKLKIDLTDHGIFVPTTHNLIDAIWTDRPSVPSTPVEILGTNRSGQSTQAKLEKLNTDLEAKGADALVMNLPESICWLFNIRGRDVPHTPVTLSFAIALNGKKPCLYVDKSKLDHAIADALSETLTIQPIDAFETDIVALATAKSTLWIDPATCPVQVVNLIADNGGKLVEQADPTHHAKTIKNEVEAAGMREAHIRDGVAVTHFLHWFDTQISAGASLSEVEIAKAMEHFRRQDETLVDISFDTISGSGPNAAMMHYRVTEQSNRTLQTGEMMLIDSGAQFLSGTTDITRTLATSDHSAEQKDCYTRVLKGMITLTTTIFPNKTTGTQIDVLARKALWDVGLNYNHGTGHGVGAFLGVHETPPSISPKGNSPLEAGMILSNEPGYYANSKFGIRIENLIHIIAHPEHQNFLKIETLTFAPIDTRLINRELMTQSELDWLNSYHQQVWTHLAHKITDPDVKSWLKLATQEF